MSPISRRSFIKGAIAVGITPLALNADVIKKSQGLKFIHVTDSHFDLQNEYSVQSLKTMVLFINEHYKDLDFVLFGGDNYNHTKDVHEAHEFKKIVSQLNVPFYAVRGNKEASQKEFNELFVDGMGLKTNDRDWLLEKNGYMILGLDSSTEGASNGSYDDETIKFAQSILEKEKPTIILNHHPYTNYWGGTEKKDIHKYVLNNTNEVQEKLFKYPNLLLTLSGHKHIDSSSEINGTKVIATRALMSPQNIKSFPMRYVEIDGKKVHEKLVYTV